MATFIIGLAILIVGAAVYGRFCERIFRPDDRQTPACTKQDGVDYIPMPKWKNQLINLLNIAGTGPIIGPIQGILFGPIAFITIVLHLSLITHHSSLSCEGSPPQLRLLTMSPH